MTPAISTDRSDACDTRAYGRYGWYSRPLSVPNQFSRGWLQPLAQVLLRRRLVSDDRANTAISTSTMMMRPSTAMRLRRKRRKGGALSSPLRRGVTLASAVTDPRVQQRVGQVHEQVDHDEHHRDEQDGALRAVRPSTDRVDHQPADAGPGGTVSGTEPPNRPPNCSPTTVMIGSIALRSA